MSSLIKIIGMGKTGREVIAWLKKAHTQGADLIPANNPSKLKIKEASLAFVVSEDAKFPKPDFLPSSAVSVAVISHPRHSSENFAEIQKNYNTTLFLSNPSSQKAMNVETIGTFLKTVVEGVSLPHVVGLDFSEVTQLLKHGKLAMLSIGHSTLKNIGKAAEQGLKSETFNFSAKVWARAYTYFIGGNDMRLDDLNKAGDILSEKLHPNTDIMWGARNEEKMKGKVTILLLLTQIEQTEKDEQKPDANENEPKPDILFKFGQRSSQIATDLIKPEAEPKISLGLEDIGIDFNMQLFKAILKGALLDKDTDKIIIRLPKANPKKLFETYIKRRIAHLQAEIEKSETLDDLTELAERIRSSKLTLTEDAIELFTQEKSRLLGMIEDKFGGTVKLA